MSAADLELMPNVQKLLVKKGTTFTNAVDSFPLCCPARATFITGQYAHNHGVEGNFSPYGWYGMKQARKHPPRLARRCGLHNGPDRQVAERLRRAGRPWRGPEGLRHLARSARRLRLRLLQLRHEHRRQAEDLGRRRVRDEPREVRDRRGRQRAGHDRVDLRQARRALRPAALQLLGDRGHRGLLARRHRQDHRRPRPRRAQVRRPVLHLVDAGRAASRGRCDDADGPAGSRSPAGAALRGEEQDLHAAAAAELQRGGHLRQVGELPGEGAADRPRRSSLSYSSTTRAASDRCSRSTTT